MKAAISVIFSGTRNGEITLVAISVRPSAGWPPAAPPADRTEPGRPGPDRQHAETDADRDEARISRSRSSTRCETKGCFGALELVPVLVVGAHRSVILAGEGGCAAGQGRPQRPSGAAPIGASSGGAGRAEARDARGARLGLGADAVALLVPLRRGPTLQAPVLVRVPVLRRRLAARLMLAARGRQRRGRLLPVLSRSAVVWRTLARRPSSRHRARRPRTGSSSSSALRARSTG